MAVFVYGILSQWYIMIALSAIVVTFWVLKGLTEAGVLQNAQQVVSSALKDTKSVARYCVPKINNLNDFWNCLQNPPDYVPTQEEQEMMSTPQESLGSNQMQKSTGLKQTTQKSTDFDTYNQCKDPYAK
ncbi:MAG: DUF2670 domain-containing protein [Rickettsiaceae bacterium]